MGKFGLQCALIVSALIGSFAAPAWALTPPDSVEAGSASLGVSGNVVTIIQGPKEVLNWDTFSIANGETINFSQPDTYSTVFFRLTGSSPTVLNGTLRSNGRMYLTNPQGFVFGANSLIEAAGLVVVAGDVSDADLLAGNFNFQSTDSYGSIVLNGRIEVVPGGSVQLVAGGGSNIASGGGITLNSGASISAVGGSVTLMGGNITINTDASILVGMDSAVCCSDSGPIVLDGAITAVPEPNTAILMFAGLGLLAVVTVRNKSTA